MCRVKYSSVETSKTYFGLQKFDLSKGHTIQQRKRRRNNERECLLIDIIFELRCVLKCVHSSLCLCVCARVCEEIRSTHQVPSNISKAFHVDGKK